MVLPLNAMNVNLDINEVSKFNDMAPYWWDPEGVCKPLHKLNPLRLSFIYQQLPLAGKAICDVGCGGGLLSEAMAKQGALVTGIDAAKDSIAVAKNHALQEQVPIDYRCITAEEWAEQQPDTYDVVTCMELIEHVPDPASLIQACTSLLKPGGAFFLSTLNRTPKSFLQAIVGAEYVLKWLPKGTHDYAHFLKPSEVISLCRHAGLHAEKIQGMGYDFLLKTFHFSPDVQVNYLLYAVKPCKGYDD